MKHFSLLILSAFIAVLASAAPHDDIGAIEKNFKNIPASQKIGAYWYWIGGNMSKEGVVKDLHAMKQAGINRALIGMIGDDQGAPAGPVRIFTDEWWDILDTMFKTATELDIEIGLFNCPGWSQSGGPWVKPEQAMRYLSYSKDTLSGPVKFNGKLSDMGEDAQPVKVLAFPLQEASSVFKAEKSGKSIVFTSETPATVRSLTVWPVEKANVSMGTLYADNGSGWAPVTTFQMDRTNPAINVGYWGFAPVVISVPEMEGTRFKLEFSKEGVCKYAELSDVPTVERFPEKSLAKMWQTPHPMWDAYMWNEQPNHDGIDPEAVIDITDKVNADGTLAWDIPAGKWVIMRTAMKPTGVTCAPAPPEGTGLETDKMSKEHIRTHFNNYLGKILERIPAEHRKTFKVVVEDSYETGGQNWTDNMIPDFKKAYGYDPVPFIPVLSGIVVGNEDMSDRFLWDLRRLIADEISYNYVGGLREVSNEHGLTTWLENYGHWGFPGDFLQYGSQSDEIGGEFWSFGDLGDIENRIASSCGHIYGKEKVWAESFTCGGPDFSQYPGQMKQRGDRFFAEGINATVLHVYVQQPDDRVPGINAWFGNEFNRNNTWFSQMDVFLQYVKRCNYMLQQGRYVADVAYFIGDDAPKMTGKRDPEVPEGYSYDYINSEVILGATVKDGKLRLSSGMEYSVLVLPKIQTMRPEVIEKLQKLVSDGLSIIGPAPVKSPSLKDYPAADVKVKTIAEELWQEQSRPFAEVVTYGKGRIYKNASIEQVMRDMGIPADFTKEDKALPVQFIHQRLADSEFYFVTNQSDKEISFDGIFRVHGKAPELWNPLTCDVRPLPQYSELTNTTKIPIVLKPYESSFIVFRNQAPAHKVTGLNYPEAQVIANISTPWTVKFQEQRGAPEGDVLFPELTDWTTNKDARIKYFSGTATYTNSFKLKKLPQTPVYIDLGKVMVMAKVKVNGKYAGGVWTAPYRLNITEFLQKGDNQIEVEVVNCWRNRLIGEKNMPESERFTFQTATYLDKDSELQSSGLLGPVVIETLEYAK